MIELSEMGGVLTWNSTWISPCSSYIFIYTRFSHLIAIFEYSVELSFEESLVFSPLLNFGQIILEQEGRGGVIFSHLETTGRDTP
jgi:hypothetical protein